MKLLAFCDQSVLNEDPIFDFPYVKERKRLIYYFYFNALFLKHLELFKEADIIHCRGHFTAYWAVKALKYLKLERKIIADIRGAISEEIKHRVKMFPLNRILYHHFFRFERRLLQMPSHLFFVSEQMKEYYGNCFPRLLDAESSVFPTVVNDTLFYPSDKKRLAVRSGLNLNDRFTYIYCGGNDCWQNIDQIILKFKEAWLKDNTLFLILLIKEPELLKDVLMKAGLDSGSYYLGSVPYQMVPDYLNAADAGIIIREDILLNRVASPTKVNEYLACGLKIIDRLDQIGQFDEFSTQYGTYTPMKEIVDGQYKVYCQLMSQD